MREYEKAIGHYRKLKKDELECYMERKGFKKVDVLYAGFPFWSPLTREAYNLVNKNANKDVMEVTYNPIIHSITFFFYRFLSAKRIGDQFVGIFEKKW